MATRLTLRSFKREKRKVSFDDIYPVTPAYVLDANSNGSVPAEISSSVHSKDSKKLANNVASSCPKLCFIPLWGWTWCYNVSLWRTPACLIPAWIQSYIISILEPRWGPLNFLSGRGVRPRFTKCGACELKFPNLEACKLKISKYGGLQLKISKTGDLRAKIWTKIEAVEAKISKFSQKGVLWTDTFAWNGALANYRRGEKRGSSGPHIPVPPF